MTEEVPGGGIEHLTASFAAVFEGVLAVQDNLGQADPITLAGVHAVAAARMVEAGEFAELSASAGDADALGADAEAAAVQRSWQAFGLVMLGIERAIDVRNPDAEPPLSEVLRARARQRHPEVDSYIPDFDTIAFVDPKPSH